MEEEVAEKERENEEEREEIGAKEHGWDRRSVLSGAVEG